MPHRILAIDDSIALRMFITKTLGLREEEFCVTTAKDGREGIKLATSSKPDLILLDYILPDMTGGDVAGTLLNDDQAKEIPVVLMSSNASDIKKAEAAYKNIVKSIAKPFTPELLTSTVRQMLRSQEDSTASPVVQKTAPVTGTSTVSPAPTAAPAAKPVTGKLMLFSGRSDLFPLYRAFTATQDAALTGVLRLRVGDTEIKYLVHQGRPVMLTTRDADAYMDGAAFPFTVQQAAGLEGALKRQRETSIPVFIALDEAGLIDHDKAIRACREQGARLLSKIWKNGAVTFDFEPQDSLPDFTGPIKPSTDGVDQWMLEGLRHVGEEALSAIAWGDLGGVPIYTRHGYERIQSLTLTREEANFLSQIGSSTLAEIATTLKVTPERAQQILFRFLSLEIFEYWPAAVLRGEV